MENIAYHSVLDVTPTKDDWIANYIGSANKLVAKHGGKYLARTGSHERVEGTGAEAALRIAIGWPSKLAAMNFMQDPEYVGKNSWFGQ